MIQGFFFGFIFASIWSTLLLKLKNSILIYLFLMIPLLGYGQLDDSTNAASAIPPDGAFEADFGIEEVDWSRRDSSLNRFFYYSPVFSSFYASTGNFGSPMISLLFQQDIESGFDLGLRSTTFHLYDEKEIQFRNTKQPYTEISYLTATQQEQFFKIDHFQNVTPNWNLGLNFQRISSIGFYFHQRVAQSDFSFHSNYTSPSKRYQVLLSGVYNDQIIEENGGISTLSDNLFEDNEELNRESIPVDLEEAENTYRDYGLRIKQNLFLGSKEALVDQKDSVLGYQLKPSHRLYHILNVKRYRMQYEDTAPDSAFFHSFSGGQTFSRINDRLSGVVLDNRVGWEFGAIEGGVPIPGRGQFWLSHQIFDVGQNSLSDAGMNLQAGGNYGFEIAQKFGFSSFGDIIFAGDNLGELSLGGELSYAFGGDSAVKWSGDHSNHVGAGLTLENRDAPFLWNSFDSDLNEWNNAVPEKIGKVNVNFSWLNKPTKSALTFDYFLINNYVYFDSIASPQQLGQVASVFQVSVQRDFSLGKFHWVPKVVLQQTDREEFIPLPFLLTNQSLFMESTLFKQALSFRMGFDFYYQTDYFSQAYFPVTRQFHLQDERQFGTYPFLDFFLQIRIKTARAFLRITHLNQGLSGQDYYLVPKYPMPDRSFRIGINWAFFN